MTMIEDPASTVGIPIPDIISWNNETIWLREEVWKLIHDGKNDEGQKRDLIEVIERILKEKIEDIRTGDITSEEGERLAEECIGLKRAKEELLKERGAIKTVGEIIKKTEVEDQRRWLNLVKKVK